MSASSGLAVPGSDGASAESSLQTWARVNDGMTVVTGRTAIAAALREAIVSGGIAAGEQLKQDELSAHFGVSPAPVREALRQLESEGLVRHYPNRGAFVSDVPADEVISVLLPVRLLLEKHALGRLLGGLDPDLVRRLQAQIDTMQRGAETNDIRMITEADVRFHELAVEASGADQTIQLWHSVLPRIRLQFYRLTPRHPDLTEVAEEHRVLLAALQSGKVEILDETLQEHIIGTSASLMQRTARTPIPEP